MSLLDLHSVYGHCINSFVLGKYKSSKCSKFWESCYSRSLSGGNYEDGKWRERDQCLTASLRGASCDSEDHSEGERISRWVWEGAGLGLCSLARSETR